MKFPLQAVRDCARWPLLALLLAISLWLWSRAGGEGRLHNSKVAPAGIVSLEHAADTVQAKRIISFWDRWEGRDFAVKTIRYDFVFLIFYSTTLALACVIAADRFRSIGEAKPTPPSELSPDSEDFNGWIRFSNFGILLAWGQWVAAALDAVENEAVLKMLNNTPTPLNTNIAWISADLKFALISMAILYSTAAVVIYFFRMYRIFAEHQSHQSN